jgi:hypothetical protein
MTQSLLARTSGSMSRLALAILVGTLTVMISALLASAVTLPRPQAPELRTAAPAAPSAQA